MAALGLAGYGSSSDDSGREVEMEDPALPRAARTDATTATAPPESDAQVLKGLSNPLVMDPFRPSPKRTVVKRNGLPLFHKPVADAGSDSDDEVRSWPGKRRHVMYRAYSNCLDAALAQHWCRRPTGLCSAFSQPSAASMALNRDASTLPSWRARSVELIRGRDAAHKAKKAARGRGAAGRHTQLPASAPQRAPGAASSYCTDRGGQRRGSGRRVPAAASCGRNGGGVPSRCADSNRRGGIHGNPGCGGRHSRRAYVCAHAALFVRIAVESWLNCARWVPDADVER
jgi:hypothetical protein